MAEPTGSDVTNNSGAENEIIIRDEQELDIPIRHLSGRMCEWRICGFADSDSRMTTDTPDEPVQIGKDK